MNLGRLKNLIQVDSSRRFARAYRGVGWDFKAPGQCWEGRVTEQEADRPVIQGKFDMVMLRWRDITFHTVEGVDPSTEEGRAELAGDIEDRGAMLQFMQFGLKVQDDPEKVVILHSLSLQPNRSEFFAIPKGVIVDMTKVATIVIDGDEFSVE